MSDMSAVIVPRSDQYNAEDFLAGPRTFCIEAVSIAPDQEQPVSISLVGETRVWRPCKSMSRCLVAVWGPDAKAYIGRSLTLYTDPKVKWGGLEVGGIRIANMSHIATAQTMVLAESKKSRKPFTIKPLKTEPVTPAASPESAKPKPTVPTWLADKAALFERAQTQVELDEIEADPELQRALVKLQGAWLDQLNAMIAKAHARLTPMDTATE